MAVVVVEGVVWCILVLIAEGWWKWRWCGSGGVGGGAGGGVGGGVGGFWRRWCLGLNKSK